MKRSYLALFLSFLLLLCPILTQAEILIHASDYPVSEGYSYSSLEEVAVYLFTYHRLPANYLTKKEAQALGWESRERNLWQVTDHGSIGGDRFGNYEEQLPEGNWVECDIDYDGGYRNGKRIVFSKDYTQLYYTGDHYQSFEPVTVLPAETASKEITVYESELYDTKAEVALYLHLFGHLPDNYVTKADAKELGWTAKKDNLGELLPGASIGGDHFQNREQLLPTDYEWYECDVNTQNGQRGRERLVYSTDGLVYYTCDGYQHFEKLY